MLLAVETEFERQHEPDVACILPGVSRNIPRKQQQRGMSGNGFDEATELAEDAAPEGPLIVPLWDQVPKT